MRVEVCFFFFVLYFDGLGEGDCLWGYTRFALFLFHFTDYSHSAVSDMLMLYISFLLLIT